MTNAHDCDAHIYTFKIISLSFSAGIVFHKKMSTTITSRISEDKCQILDDGTKINYCTSGTGEHPVLLLPGALGTGRSDFTPQLQGMSYNISV